MRRDDLSDMRVPAHSVEAEASVLCAILTDNQAFDLVADLVQESDFYRAENRTVFASISSLISAGKVADAITVFESLKASGLDEQAGGLPHIVALSNGHGSPRNARRYAEIIREQSVLRRLATAADEIHALAHAADGSPVADRVDAAQQKLQEIHAGTGRRMPEAIQASVVRLIDRVQAAADGEAPPSVSTGIPMLDRMLGGGLKGGKQVILAARPSVGKSSLAAHFCLHLARHGYPTAYLSQEMGKDELTERAVANVAGVELDSIIAGRMSDDEWRRFSTGLDMLRDIPLFLDDQPALTLHDIAAKLRGMKRQHGIKLAAIDYIQLCAAGSKDADSRHHQIEALSRGLKTLAKQLDITILTLSQLNREVEKRASGRPILSDLKESGAIEEDADVVMLLSRLGERGGPMQTLVLDVAKNRQGRVGAVALAYSGAYQQWTETVMPEEPAKKGGRGKVWTDDL